MSILSDFDPDDILSVEVVGHEPQQGPNSTARKVALQVLYEVDITKHTVGEVLAQRLEYEQPDKIARKYLQQILDGVTEHLTEYDAMIAACSDVWAFKDLAYIDRNILRVAIFELLNNERLPIAIIIDQALRLCDVYGSEDTARFVNGVLSGVLERYNINRSETVPLDGENLP